MHLAWYRGELTAALETAQQLYISTNQSAPDKRHLYCLTLLGNLYRSVGNFERVQHFYISAHDVAHQLNLTRYVPWLDVQEGWLYVMIPALPPPT